MALHSNKPNRPPRLSVFDFDIETSPAQLVSFVGPLSNVTTAASLALTCVQPDAQALHSIAVLLPNDALPFVRGKRGDLAATQGDLEVVIAASGVSVALSPAMMPDSSERAMTLGGPRSRLEVAVSLLSAAVDQFAKHGDTETWVKHIPPATRGPGSVSAASSMGGMGGFPRPGGMGFGAGGAPFGVGMGAAYSMGSYGGGGSGGASSHRGPNMGGSGVSSGLGSALGLQRSPEAYQIAMSVPIVAAAVSGAYSLGPGQIQVEVSIPHATAGAVIGRAGSVINELIRQSGAQIKVGDAQQSTERCVRVMGTPQQVQYALSLLGNTLHADPHYQRLHTQLASGMPVSTAQFTVPEACVGPIFGKKGAATLPLYHFNAKSLILCSCYLE
jgi:hypothetical protein